MRRKTRAVRIGSLILSSERPPVIQSMLNTSTLDTEGCVEQAIRIIRAGGQLVRITAQGVREAENLKNIRALLSDRGYHTPLSADIHFNPAAAEVAARYVEKVRINPGNFADKRATFRQVNYTEEEYAAELEMLKRKFTDLLKICREYHTAVRIGTNHGSLSDRIMSRYGNTPEGMVEASLEYLRVCRDTAFDDVVISLKSSDCRVMVEAVRLLVKRMEEEEMDYPLHLGVTEAGEGEDGRIRSAVGIGTLLNEGLGDTLRVSLTEAPEAEIPVAKLLADLCVPDYRKDRFPVKGTFSRPVLVADITSAGMPDQTTIVLSGFKSVSAPEVRQGAGLQWPEMVYTETPGTAWEKLPESVTVILPFSVGETADIRRQNVGLLWTPSEVEAYFPGSAVGEPWIRIDKIEEIDRLAGRLEKIPQAVLVLSPGVDYRAYDAMLSRMTEKGLSHKVVLRAESQEKERSVAALQVAAHTGGFFLDKRAYGLWIHTPSVGDAAFDLELGRNILQSAGARRYKTEFISCPGCGRTLYNLQGAVAQVKQAFSHLHKLKIAIMGCVVNGPGEMGDADYGYVGAGNGKVNLYKGKQMVRAGVPEEEAIEALKQLIREGGDWTERIQE